MATPAQKYELIKQEVTDTPAKGLVATHAIAIQPWTRSGIEELLDYFLWDASANVNLRHHSQGPALIFVYIYESKAHYDSGMGQWIAMLGKSGLNAQPSKQYKEHLFEVETDSPAELEFPVETLHGLEESIRKEIFAELIRIEDRATKEADRRFPLPTPGSADFSRVDLEEQIERQHRVIRAMTELAEERLARKHGIDLEALKAIGSEGLRKNWPMPALE